MATDDTARRVTTPTGDPAWLVTGYRAVKALLLDARLGRSHPDPQRAARFTDAAMFWEPGAIDPAAERNHHAMMRSLLAPSFSAKRMGLLRPRIQEVLDDLLDELSLQTPPSDFHEAVSFPLPALVICELLGVPYEDRDRFRRWSDDAGDTSDRARSQAGLAQLRAYVAELAARKRAEPAEDVISDMVGAQRLAPDRFTDGHLSALAAGLLFAGHETTVTAIDTGIVLLLTNPAQREALVRDSGLINHAVEEILRAPARGGTSNSASGIPYWTNAEVQVGDVTIPPGDLVLLDLHAANEDERVFAEPQSFDVTRQPNPHLKFSHGPHFCLGAPLARVELQTVLGTVFRRFPDLRLAVPVDDLQPRTDLLTGGLLSLPVAW